jgi:protein TonB
MKNQIQNIKLNFKCDKNILLTDSSNKHYYCKKCDKNIIDFRLKTKKELENEIIKANGNVCGIFNKQQVKSSNKISKIFGSILIALGLNLISEKSHAQNLDSLNFESEKVISEDMIIGEFEIYPVYKNGGREGLQKFLSEKMVYPDSLMESGKVIIQFTVDTTGHVTEIKLVKGFNKYADMEALRICSLLEFTPGYRLGKPIKSTFLLPIKFEAPTERKKPYR